MASTLFNARAARAGESSYFVAQSAGTWALDTHPASGYALTAMAERGLDLTDHRAHTIQASDMEDASVVIVMTRSHRDALAAEFPEFRSKLHLMSELSGRVFDISDPYGGSLAEYQYCARELEELVEEGYDVIKTWAWGDSH
jgi:protein-tyrosine-phosphatase